MPPSRPAAFRPVHFGEVIATLYHHQLVINPNQSPINDLAGRPQFLTDHHPVMRELV